MEWLIILTTVDSQKIRSESFALLKTEKTLAILSMTNNKTVFGLSFAMVPLIFTGCGGETPAPAPAAPEASAATKSDATKSGGSILSNPFNEAEKTGKKK